MGETVPSLCEPRPHGQEALGASISPVKVWRKKTTGLLGTAHLARCSLGPLFLLSFTPISLLSLPRGYFLFSFLSAASLIQYASHTGVIFPSLWTLLNPTFSHRILSTIDFISVSQLHFKLLTGENFLTFSVDTLCIDHSNCLENTNKYFEHCHWMFNLPTTLK